MFWTSLLFDAGVLLTYFIQWLLVAIVRDFASVKREEVGYKQRLLWDKYDDIWHATGAYLRSVEAFYLLYLNFRRLHGLSWWFVLIPWVGFSTFWWIGFDLGFNKLREKPLLRVGKSAWLDQLTQKIHDKIKNTKLARKHQLTPELTGLGLKLALLLLTIVLTVVLFLFGR